MYKRQELGHGRSRDSGRLRYKHGVVALLVTAAVVAVVLHIMAVSYTHLDVYKRQPERYIEIVGAYLFGERHTNVPTECGSNSCIMCRLSFKISLVFSE